MKTLRQAIVEFAEHSGPLEDANFQDSERIFILGVARLLGFADDEATYSPMMRLIPGGPMYEFDAFLIPRDWTDPAVVVEVRPRGISQPLEEIALRQISRSGADAAIVITPDHLLAARV